MREQYIEGKTTLKEVFAILDACEAANLKHLQRIEQLEELCRDLYFCAEHSKCDYCEHFEPQNDSLMSCDLMLEDRMTALGLLGGNND